MVDLIGGYISALVLDDLESLAYSERSPRIPAVGQRADPREYSNAKVRLALETREKLACDAGSVLGALLDRYLYEAYRFYNVSRIDKKTNKLDSEELARAIGYVPPEPEVIRGVQQPVKTFPEFRQGTHDTKVEYAMFGLNSSIIHNPIGKPLCHAPNGDKTQPIRYDSIVGLKPSDKAITLYPSSNEEFKQRVAELEQEIYSSVLFSGRSKPKPDLVSVAQDYADLKKKYERLQQKTSQLSARLVDALAKLGKGAREKDAARAAREAAREAAQAFQDENAFATRYGFGPPGGEPGILMPTGSKLSAALSPTSSASSFRPIPLSPRSNGM